MAEGSRVLQTYCFTVFVLILSMAALVRAQDAECSMCWRELGNLVSVLSQHEDNEYRSSGLDSRYPVERVRRSAAAFTTDTSSCAECWSALDVLTLRPRYTKEKTGTGKFRNFIKKAMLNNGWV